MAKPNRDLEDLARSYMIERAGLREQSDLERLVAFARRVLVHVDFLAQADMLKGNPIEGAHSRAILRMLNKEVLKP